MYYFRFIEITERIPRVQKLNYSTKLRNNPLNIYVPGMNLEHLTTQQKMKSRVKQNQQIESADILASTIIPQF